MRENRWILGIITAALAIIAIGGALIVARLHDVSATNSRFICGFGAAISAKPLAKKHSETATEFRQRVRQTREFVNGLSQDLENCDVPTTIRIAKNSEKLLPSKGVVPSNSPSSGSSKPGGSKRPPSGGLTGDPPTVPSVPVPSAPSSPLRPVCDVLPDVDVPLSPLCP